MSARAIKTTLAIKITPDTFFIAHLLQCGFIEARLCANLDLDGEVNVLEVNFLHRGVQESRFYEALKYEAKLDDGGQNTSNVDQPPGHYGHVRALHVLPNINYFLSFCVFALLTVFESF